MLNWYNKKEFNTLVTSDYRPNTQWVWKILSGERMMQQLNDQKNEMVHLTVFGDVNELLLSTI
jgi:hypothetical protein